MPPVNKDSVFLLPSAKHHQTSLAYPNFIECALLTHVHGILQVRIPEWVQISFSGDLPDPVSLASPALAGGIFTSAPPGKPTNWLLCLNVSFQWSKGPLPPPYNSGLWGSHYEADKLPPIVTQGCRMPEWVATQRTHIYVASVLNQSCHFSVWVSFFSSWHRQMLMFTTSWYISC